jgi:acyl carrier protein
MADQTALQHLVFAVIDELNEVEFADKPVAKAIDTPLFGSSGQLDSLDLVTLVLAIEDRTADELGRRLSLANDRAMSQERSPFRTIGTLVDYMATLLDEKSDG